MFKFVDSRGAEECPRGHLLTSATAHLEVNWEMQRDWAICHACVLGEPADDWERLFGYRPATNSSRPYVSPERLQAIQAAA